jgi:hypothetical protein
MIRNLSTLVLVATLGAATVARAHEHAAMGHHAAMASARPTTLSGEVVDTGCYLGDAERGEKHISCATKCINNGMPMGLLTADGRLYLLMLNHDNPDPYNKLKQMPGKTVTVTGAVFERSGMKGIDVTDAKLAAAVPASKK